MAVQHSHNGKIDMRFCTYFYLFNSCNLYKPQKSKTAQQKATKATLKMNSLKALHHMERENTTVFIPLPTNPLSSTATTGNFTPTHLFQQDDPVDEGVQGWGKDAQFDANKYGSHHISP